MHTKIGLVLYLNFLFFIWNLKNQLNIMKYAYLMNFYFRNKKKKFLVNLFSCVSYILINGKKTSLIAIKEAFLVRYLSHNFQDYCQW